MAHPTARPEVLALRTSQIRQVANAGLGRADVLPFWFGESDQPTPLFIREAAARALAEGRTFYTHNLGRADLREALAAYLTRLHHRPIAIERLAITNSGVSALMIAAQAVVSPGDRVVVVAPVWPNVVEIPRILSARVETVALEPKAGSWRLDLDRLMSALTPDTRALFLNSPNNPTGWTLPAEDRAPILARCRELGVWLIADDVYERLNFRPTALAPSFLEIASEEDRLISTNSFSKAWRMTGWRLGWMVMPPSLTPSVGALLEYNTSCAPDFIQTAADRGLERRRGGNRRVPGRTGSGASSGADGPSRHPGYRGARTGRRPLRLLQDKGLHRRGRLGHAPGRGGRPWLRTGLRVRR